MRLGEVKQLSQSHTASKCESGFKPKSEKKKKKKPKSAQYFPESWLLKRLKS